MLIYALESGTKEVSVIIVLGKLEYFSVVSSGILWLCFTLDYTGSNWWKLPRNLIAVCIIPALILILSWTNELHGWIWSNVYLIQGSLVTNGVWVGGPLYLINPFYQYLLYFIGIIILLRYAGKRPHKSKRPVFLLVIGTIIPLIGSILYVFKVLQPDGHDIFPLYIFTALIFYCIAIIGYRLVDVVPVAYEALIKDIPDGILVLDSSDHIKEMNTVCEKLLNVRKSVVQSWPLAEIWPQLQGLIGQTQNVENAELTHNNKGVISDLNVSMVVLRNKKGSLIGKLIVIRDISVLKNVQSNLEELVKKEQGLRNNLEEEAQKRKQYSRAIVHELRTPLTAIMASSELLGELVKEKIPAELVRNIQRSSHNLELRINELFELARGELGLIKIDPADLDLSTLIEEIISEMKPVATEKKLNLVGELPGTILPISGDKGRLSQVLHNIIGNSLKFTSHGSIVIRAFKLDSEHVEVQVKDTGRGIKAEDLKNLFDPYQRQNKDKTNTSGLGLGLALSKIYVELHQGTISAESIEGRGTTISFVLPTKIQI